MADDADAFILLNRCVGGDVFDPELGDYTDPIWETVILRAPADVVEDIPTGPDSSGRLEWSDGFVSWNTVAVKPFVHGDGLVTFAVSGMLSYLTSLDGALCEFLINLELKSTAGKWRLKRSAMGPSGFSLTRCEPPS